MNNPPPPEVVFPEDGSTTSSNTNNLVVRALEEHGCFMAKYKKLELCHENLFRRLTMIFNLPPGTKERNVSDIPDFSYEQNHPVLRPLYESFGIREATSQEDTQNFITSMWPGGNNDIRNDILAYTRTAAVLEDMVRQIVFDHYGVRHDFQTGYIFRMMKYKEEVRLGCSDRTNRMEFLAVLDLNKVDGLEMKYNGQWFQIDVKPSTFLIMAGRPLEDWSNGRIHPPELRVRMHRIAEERYSVGLFSYYDKGKIDKGKIDKGKIDKGKIDKGRIDKGKTEASKKQVGN
ncbi:hypothetical protein K2173_018997 [Erythroxylum novogranatense]|uniref:Isopenicillin N synthase-like Fe(2+) 2OG dioxygenase domain-containing protein n=1 Tax=Erythroxylum novogranatense TaxID=1862640 RepID=A0AAV8STB3_9ROSI|nr:hypothetical protein K2173_018997 [Erythroxylum novogranatense]